MKKLLIAFAACAAVASANAGTDSWTYDSEGKTMIGAATVEPSAGLMILVK